MPIYDSLNQLVTTITLWSQATYPKLMTSIFLQYLAIVVTTILVGCWIRRRFLYQNGPRDHETTNETNHFIIMGFLLLLLVSQAVNLWRTGALAPFCLMLLVNGAAIVMLLTWHRMGLPLALAGFWISLSLPELPGLLAVRNDWNELARFTPAGKVTILAMATHYKDQILVKALLAMILSLITVGYYSKYRFLFVENADYTLAETKQNTKQDKSADQTAKKRKASLGGIILDKLKEELGGVLIKIAVIVAVILIAFIPLYYENSVRYLVNGSAAANNAFIDKYKEWRQDSSIAEDADWLEDFDSANQALFDVNARGFRIMPGGMTHSNLYVYIGYLDASYSQMTVQQMIEDAVHNGDTASSEQLGNYWDQTVRMQAKAIKNAPDLTEIGGFVDCLRRLGLIFMDGLRFAFSCLPTWILLLILGSMSTFAVYRLKVLHRRPLPIPIFIDRTPAEDTVTQTATKTATKKNIKEYLPNILGIILGVIMIPVSAELAELTMPEETYTYESALVEVFATDVGRLVMWMSDCSTDPKTAFSEKEDILECLDSCFEALEFLKNAEAPEYLQEDAELLSQTVEDLSVVLLDVKQELEADKLPDMELKNKCTELMKTGMNVTQYMITYYTLNALGDN